MFTKWDHDYGASLKLSQMTDDGMRFRWWLLACLSNKMVFPGLLAGNSLHPLRELELVSKVYTDKVFQDPMKALEKWREEKKVFVDLGVLISRNIGGLEYLWNYQHHFYQDKGTRWEASLGRKFAEGFDKLDLKKRILFLQLLLAFRPVDVSIYDAINDSSIDLSDPDWEGLKFKVQSSIVEVVNKNNKNRKLDVQSVNLLYRSRGLHQKAESKPRDPKINEFIKWWCGKYRSMFNQKYIVNGKDAKLVQTMLRVFTYDELVKLAEKFFTSEDKFVKKAGCTLGVFKSQINTLVSGESKDKWEKFLEGN